MAEPETEKKTSSVMLDSSLLEDCVSKLKLSPSHSAKMAQTATKEQRLSMPDWTLLPEELLNIISENLDNYLDVVHARSVCSSWRSTMPFPSHLIRPIYHLPMFNEDSLETKGFCTLKKIPLFLFSVRTPSAAPDFEYLLGGIGRRDESEDQKELPSPPMQRSVKVNMGIRLPALINMLDFQILSLGYQYRMIGMKLKDYRGMAFLPLNKEGGREFVVILNCRGVLFVLTSAEMKWKRLDHVPKEEACWDLVTFRGKFYASFYSRRTVVVDPYFLEVTTLLMPSPHQGLFNHLVPCGDDELFLVERNFSQSSLIVSRLDEEAGEWVVVTDLGDRVFFINELPLGNVCCLAKELPDGCGVSGNSILFTNQISDVTYSYKYGVREEDGLKCWSLSRDKRVTRLSMTRLSRYSTVAFRVEHASP